MFFALLSVLVSVYSRWSNGGANKFDKGGVDAFLLMAYDLLGEPVISDF